MKKSELIYTVLEKLNIQSDDTHISQELVSSLLDTKRAMLLKQQYSAKGWHLPIEVKQEVCLGLEQVDAVGGYSCAGKMLSTSDPLPRSIKIKGKEGPLLIRKEDNTVIAINLVSIERVPFLFSNKFTAMLTYAAVDYDGKLVLISADNKLRFLTSIKVTDVFESPDNVHDIMCSNTSENTKTGTIVPWDEEYPVESAMADVLINMIVQELLRTKQIPGDDINNATDEQPTPQPTRRRRRQSGY
jgi:hypothetical protein